MEQKIIFREMLSEVKALADQKGNRLTVEEIDAFFANAHLEKDQMKLIYEYLQDQRIRVEGYEKAGAPSLNLSGQSDSTGKKTEETREEGESDELNSIQIYLEELEQTESLEPEEELLLFRQSAAGDRAARERLIRRYLPLICEMAGNYEGDEILTEDLIQEGNMGLLVTLEKMEMAESLAAFQAQLMNGVNQYLQEVLREQKDILEMGRGIESRVNHLSQAIHNLEEELEHRVSVEELSAYLEMPAEEIKDILKMAGDELKVEGYENR